MRQHTKQEAISKLQRLIEQAGSINRSNFNYPEVEKWIRSVKLALGNIFGDKSEHVSEFNKIIFVPNWVQTDDSRRNTSLDGLARAKGLLESMVDEIQDYWEEGGNVVTAAPLPKQVKEEVELEVKPCVFIGHGRSKLWARLKIFIEDDLKLSTITYESESRVGESIVPILEQMLDSASFAILVLTAEDETAEGRRRARQNVIHEAGLFQGRLGFRRAVVLRQDGLEDFTNVAGLQYIGFIGDAIEQTFYELQRVLKREGMLR